MAGWPRCLQCFMKLTRAHAYLIVPGILVGGVLLGLVSGWSGIGVAAGAVIGGVVAPAALTVGQWVLGEMMSEPYRP
jgi:hypothetical protein